VGKTNLFYNQENLSQKHPHERGEDPGQRSVQSPSLEKHPHERGEDPCTGVGVFFDPETPPRAWGRHFRKTLQTSKAGNTPTSVGKTEKVSILQQG